MRHTRSLGLVITALILQARLVGAEHRRYVFPDAAHSHNTVTLSPSLFHSDFVGEVQVAVNGPWCVAFGFTARSEFSDTDDVEAVTFDVGGRYYLLGRSTGGLAVGATAGAGMVEATFPTGPDKELAARAGLQTSGVWVPFGRLVLSAAVGMAYEHVSVHHGSRMMGHNGLAPQARAGIGISF